MVKSFTHGPNDCRFCFPSQSNTLEIGDWKLTNNPGYYGAKEPTILILGFSKGANQNKAAELGDFDKIAFSGARHRLQKILETFGIMPKDRDIHHLMTAREVSFGVASLVRCSFCKLKNGRWVTSGDVIPSAFSNNSTRGIIESCAKTFLSDLPRNTRMVILLGTADSYIRSTKEIFRKIYSDFRELNQVSFMAGNALWVYAAHPSPGNGHFESWVSHDPGNSSGKKCLEAMETISTNFNHSLLAS